MLFVFQYGEDTMISHCNNVSWDARQIHDTKKLINCLNWHLCENVETSENMLHFRETGR